MGAILATGSGGSGGLPRFHLYLAQTSRTTLDDAAERLRQRAPGMAVFTAPDHDLAVLKQHTMEKQEHSRRYFPAPIRASQWS